MGAALDNPDVVDKESALFALDSFIALHRAGASPPLDSSTWLSRAVSAGIVAASWHRLTDVPNPVDARDKVGHPRHSFPCPTSFTSHRNHLHPLC
jgi:hypothetical protein